VAGLFLATLTLRPQLLAIGPLLPLIRDDLQLSASAAGLLTTIPVLCMGFFAPIGPVVAARLGPRLALGMCLGLIVGSGLLRAVLPAFPLVLLATFGVGLGIGMAGAIPSMIVSQRVASRPALGTGAYVSGIVAGSALAAAVAVPLAIDGDWRRSLLIVSAASFVSIAAWFLLVRGDGPTGPLRATVPRMPWRNPTGWLLVAVFGLQSLLYFGIIAWLPNVFVERGWTPADAGSLLAICNGVGLITTVGVPLVADRLGTRRQQLLLASIVATFALVGFIALPALAYFWAALVGFALGAVFPLVMTLPLDVADEPGQVGSVAALMLFGGYIMSAVGPFALGAARDATGDFAASLWILVAVAVVLVVCCLWLSPGRLRRGIQRDRAVESASPEPTLRLAGDGDAEAIRELVAAAYGGYAPLLGRTPMPMLTDYAAAVRQHDVWVLESDRAVIGVIELVAHDDHLWIDNVAILPAWQRRGLGRRLLAHAESEARRRQVPELRLLTNERYVDNIAMYLRYGYRETGRRPHLGTDLVHFVKPLRGAPQLLESVAPEASPAVSQSTR
jgi:CP family cyanate transporter-like MFS transporter